MPYAASVRCAEKLCNLEGYRMHMYKDSGGLPTIGYGQRCGEREFPDGISKDEAMKFVIGRLVDICKLLDEHLHGLMPHQVDALCLFIYNIGWGQFHDTGSVFKLIRDRRPGVIQIWNRYVNDAHGEAQAGLVTRRQMETALFIYGWEPKA